MRPRGGFFMEPGWHSAAWQAFHAGVLLLVVAALVVGVVLLVRASRSHAVPGQAGGQRFAGPATPADPAHLELRMRYARGEIDRAEYWQRAADLGSTGPIAGPPPFRPGPPAGAPMPPFASYSPTAPAPGGQMPPPIPAPPAPPAPAPPAPPAPPATDLPPTGDGS